MRAGLPLYIMGFLPPVSKPPARERPFYVATSVMQARGQGLLGQH
jgi:hypothetical protein